MTFSYSLTMIPDWFAAVDEAHRLLKPGGTIGVVDFYVSRRYPAEGLRKHSYFARNFWPFWFGNDNVHPSADHLPLLQRRFETVSVSEHHGKLPWVPVVRAPYYRFVGTKKAIITPPTSVGGSPSLDRSGDSAVPTSHFQLSALPTVATICSTA